MKKDEILNRWSGLEPDQKIKFGSIPYKHKGSTFDCDGIRITGSQSFIDSVLSRLQDVLEYEGIETRLQLNYQQATDKETRLPLNSYCCYIQVRERGSEGKMLQAYMSGDPRKVRKLHERNINTAMGMLD